MYFDSTGEKHTDETLRLAVKACQERGIKHLVVASTAGPTAAKALELVKGTGLRLVVVTHNWGFAEEGRNEFGDEIRKAIEQAGHKVHSGMLLTRNLGKAIALKTGGHSESELIAGTLRVFGQGVKVCVEMACMVADAGLVPAADCVFVAGTGKGADTALIIRPAASHKFFDLKVREIICKPSKF